MTSKNLFFKLIWQDFKKRIWCPIIIFIAFLLSMEVPLLNSLDNMKRYPSNYSYDMKHYIANEFFSPDMNVIILFMTGIVAAVCAFSGYAYLHSRKQLDTFHSMPVKREVLFFARYLSGIFMFFIPFILHILFCLLISLSNSAFSRHGLVNATGFLGIQIVCFLLIYSLCIFVICLTGNVIISILGGCVLVGYSTILSAIKEALYDTFFHTYVSSYGEKLWAFSPIGMLIKLYSKSYEYREQNIGFSYRSIIPYSCVILIAILVFTVISVFVYRKRATEAAGKPIAFGITEPFIKSIVVLPVSVLSGFFIRAMADSESFGWFVFGVIFGFLVFSLVMEVIFRLDIRCALYHWKQMIFNGVCLALIILIFKNDVLGYNTYVPNDQELDGCAASINGLMTIYLEERTARNGYSYYDGTRYCFEHMNIIDNPSAMELARKAASDGLTMIEYEYYEGIEDTPEYQEILEQVENYRMVTFQFTKKNGNKIYRQYYIDISDEDTMRLLADIFDDPEYKLGAFPILTNGWKKEYSGIECISNDFQGEVLLSPERQARLFEAYQSDIMKLTLDDVMHVAPLGNIDFRLKGYSRYESGGREEGYKIYPDFTATITLLKEYGFDFTDTLSENQVKKIIIEKYYDELTEDGNGQEMAVMVDTKFDDFIELEYTDQENIREILPNLVNHETLSGIYGWLTTVNTDEDVTVCFDKNGVEMSNNYCFYTNEKPDFIESAFKEKLEEMIEERSSKE